MNFTVKQENSEFKPVKVSFTIEDGHLFDQIKEVFKQVENNCETVSFILQDSCNYEDVDTFLDELFEAIAKNAR